MCEGAEVSQSRCRLLVCFFKAFHEPGLNTLSSTVAIGLLTRTRLEHVQTYWNFPCTSGKQVPVKERVC